jgi:hypothetical protein
MEDPLSVQRIIETFVIPGDAPLGAGPESINADRGYGFRARASRAPE